MSNFKLLTTVPCLILLILTVLSDVSTAIRRIPSPARSSHPVNAGQPQHRALSQAPRNHAVLVGETVVLECSVVVPPPTSRVMWGEFITYTGGSTISDNDIILAHPNSARYRIIHVSPTQFDLEIRDVTLADGGKYACLDTMSGPPDLYRGEAELIVLESNPNCSTTVPADGIVLEDQSYTVECIIHYQGKYAPTMTWSGPPPYNVGNSPPNPTTVWSGVAYNVSRTMDARVFECLTNFADIGSVPPDVANNTPSWQHLYRTPQMFVFWGPKNLYIVPITSEYAENETLTCFADAYPAPIYQWQNTRTLEIYDGQEFRIRPDMAGYNQTMWCKAYSVIRGVIFSADVFQPVYVPVTWGPKNMYIVPIKAEYAESETLTCFADASPPPIYQWHNMRNLEIYSGQEFRIRPDMVGHNQTMMCQALNVIEGIIHTANIFQPVYVPGIRLKKRR